MKIKTEFTIALLLETDFQNYYNVKNKAKTIARNFMHYVSIHQIFHSNELFKV